MSILITFSNNLDSFIKIFLVALIIIFINVFVKKIAAKHYDIIIEHKIFEFQRYGFFKSSELKKPFPIGLILPIMVSVLTLGALKPFTFLQMNEENSQTRVLKKRGRYKYSEINDEDIAFTCAYGFWALILLAILGYLFRIPELTKYSIYYGLWNLIPIGRLDGTKLFFGSFFNWILLVISYLFSLIFVIL
jgi:hypothetical protein